MARTVREASLANRAARFRLAVSGKPYWRVLEQGLHLGYRRRATGGSWIARRRLDSGRYREGIIALADDLQDTDGAEVLDFSQAQAAARRWWLDEQRSDQGLGRARRGPYTVKQACDDYLEDYRRRGGRAVDTIGYAFGGHVLPKLGPTAVSKLTARQLQDWHRSLAEMPRRLRTRPGAPQRYAKFDVNDPEAVRVRRATAMVISALLLASLATGSAAQDRCAKVVGVWTAKLSVNNETESGRILSSYVIEFKSDGTAVRRGKRSACSWSCSGNKVDVNCFPYSLDVANVDWVISADGKMSDANFPQNVAIRQSDPNAVSSAPAQSAPGHRCVANCESPPAEIAARAMPECRKLLAAMDTCIRKEPVEQARAKMIELRTKLLEIVKDKNSFASSLCVHDLKNWATCLRTAAVPAPQENKITTSNCPPGWEPTDLPGECRNPSGGESYACPPGWESSFSEKGGCKLHREPTAQERAIKAKLSACVSGCMKIPFRAANQQDPQIQCLIRCQEKYPPP